MSELVIHQGDVDVAAMGGEDVDLEADVSTNVRRRHWSIPLILSCTWLATVIVSAILQPWLPIDDYRESDYLAVAVPPLSPDHILGTDEIGRDMLARLIVGARVSLLVGFGAIAIATVIGSFLGVVAGFFRGASDKIISGLVDIVLAFLDWSR